MAAVYAWGEARSGTLGTNNSEHDILASPHQIQSLQDIEITNISCAENHTLVCLQDGTVRISGSRCLAQHSGQEKLAEFETLRKGLEANQVIEVAAGSFHSVVLTQTHKVFTWGKNNCGQLGRGDIPTATQEIPRPVDFLAHHNVLQVACGNSHTIVLTDGGLVAAWGSNFYGQLGIGQTNTNPHLDKPAFVSSLKGIPVAQVTAGGNHSFILSMKGAVYGWGRNNCGQLGVNETQDKFLPKQCQDLQSKNIKYICCGDNHTACLSLDGEVFTFGDNSHGQLGHSSYETVISPEKTVDLSDLGLPDCQVSQIACGSNHTLIYVSANGSLYSFGLGRSGQLGHSDTENKSFPVLVQDLSLQEIDNQGTKLIIRSIYAGGDHSFVVAQDANTCEPKDFRKEDRERQILTLNEQNIEMILTCDRNDSSFKTLSREVKEIFSHASCLNGSFLELTDSEYCGNSHKMDIYMMRDFFAELQKSNNPLISSISTGIKKLVHDLMSSSPDVEALNLYIILPECHLFDIRKFYYSTICPFAKSMLALTNDSWRILVMWWESMGWSSFERLITIYRNLVTYLLKQPDPKDQNDLFKKNAGLHTSLEMLKKLLEVDEMFIQSKFYEKFYVPAMNERMIENGSLNHSQFMYSSSEGFSLADYFFTLDLETKYRLIEIESNRKMMRAIKGAQLLSLDDVIRNGLKPVQPFNPQGLYLILAVSTEIILEDAHAQLQGRPEGDLKKPLKVFFFDQPPVFEMIMRKEFFNLFFQAVTDPKNGFFKKEDKDRMWFEKNAVDKLDMFKTIGIICGLAIYNSVLVNLPFPLVLYKKLLKRPVSLEDLEDFMPDQKRSFQSILDTNVTGADLTFEYADGEVCPGGKDKEVTEENKKEFIDMAVDFILNKSIETQFSAFRQGFYAICDGELLKLLHPRELEALLVGNADYDFKILEANTKYEGDYDKNHPTIKYFWEVVHKMNLEDQKKLLLFYRASDRLPVSGMASVELTIQPYPVQLHLLPIAYTCHKLISLPSYKTKEVMTDRLHTAIGVQGFHLKAP